MWQFLLFHLQKFMQGLGNKRNDKRNDYLWIEEQNIKDLKISDWVLSTYTEGEKRPLDFMEQNYSFGTVDQVVGSRLNMDPRSAVVMIESSG